MVNFNIKYYFPIISILFISVFANGIPLISNINALGALANIIKINPKDLQSDKPVLLLEKIFEGRISSSGIKQNGSISLVSLPRYGYNNSYALWQSDNSDFNIKTINTIVIDAVLSPDSNKIAIVSEHKLQIIDTVTEDEIFTEEINLQRYAIFSPDSSQIAFTIDQKVKVCKLQLPHSCFQIISPDGSTIRSIQYNHSGNLIVILYYNGLGIIADSSTGQEIFTINSSSSNNVEKIYNISVNADGNEVLAIFNNGRARIYTDNGKKIIVLKHEGVFYGTFSTDGRRIVTLSRTSARIWHSNGQLMADLVGANDFLFAAFDPQGTHVVTTHINKRALVWDLELAKPIIELNELDNLERAIFVLNGLAIITVERPSDLFSKVKVWLLPLPKLIRPDNLKLLIIKEWLKNYDKDHGSFIDFIDHLVEQNHSNREKVKCDLASVLSTLPYAFIMYLEQILPGLISELTLAS